MGHSQAGKSDNHERIVKIAAQRFREKGVDGLSVAELMQEAGLTHGGFYRHFDSREDLVAEAVECALEQGSHRAVALTGGRKSMFNALVDAYLEPEHRDDFGEGCAVTALAADVTRANERARSAYTRQVRRYVDFIRYSLEQGGRKAPRQEVMLALSAMIGALSLARAVNDDQLSLEILKSTAGALKSREG